MLSVDNFCKQYGPRFGPTKVKPGQDPNLFDTLMVFLIEVGLEGKLAGSKCEFPSRQGVNDYRMGRKKKDFFF